MPAPSRKKYPLALFVGNGVHCVDKGVEWHMLLRNLVAFLHLQQEVDITAKPFPLFYEEIVLAAAAKSKINESEVKRYIASEMDNMTPNEIHHLVAQKSFAEIITTNYDRTLESACGLTGIQWNAGVQSERKYNIFRFNRSGATRIWHIHGDVGAIQSITLGYDHYSGQLQRMRGYIATGTGEAYQKQYPPLIRLLKQQKAVPDESWLQFFFTHEIHMIGFSFDFVEIDLWWLLSYRARAFHLEGALSQLSPIYYYYPQSLEHKLATRLSLMKSFGVRCVAYPLAGKGYYLEILQRLRP